MGKPEKYDYEGWVTRYNVKCSDGITIRNGSFKDCNGVSVPMVWHHLHDDPELVLGNVYLEERLEGVYGYGTFNNTQKAAICKELVSHGDIKALSIHANQLTKNGSDVLHGTIREVSLVMAGANPKASIEGITISHSDGSYEDVEDEFILKMGTQDCGIKVFSEPDTKNNVQHSDNLPTVEEVFNSMTDPQKNLLAMVMEAASSQNDETEGVEHNENIEGGDTLKTNVFEKGGDNNATAIQGASITKSAMGPKLSKADEEAIFHDAMKLGSLKDAILSHADDLTERYGIENIGYLFPDAKVVTNTPEWIKRKTDWVSDVINGARHTPFSRIKSLAADITADEARAKGYLKGKKKKEEVFNLLKRVTTPTTVYKMQKFDRDDIVDITSFDVVGWVRAEMRMMLEEELARAALISDGRDVTSNDKISETNIRPIATDDSLYTIRYKTTSTSADDLIDDVVKAQKDYEGTGRPSLYLSPGLVTDMLLVKDLNKRRIYATENELASAMRVSKIVEVPVMKDFTISETTDGASSTTTVYDVLGILVNMVDYTFGADRGGQISSFDDFDIQYNQYRYLIETRCSGCLTRVKSAVVILRAKPSSKE